MAYSFIGYQTLYIATNWDPIYWNTACLIINSGSLEDNSEISIVDIHAQEAEDLANGVTFQDLPDGKTKVRKTAATDYAKMAKAIGEIISKGNCHVSLVDINKSSYSFEPDKENNTILFGMKGLNKVGDNVIEQIIQNRPYKGIIDFMNKCPLSKTVMVSLIKAGAFDILDAKWASKIHKIPRVGIMAFYLYKVSNLKEKVTLQNFNSLLEYKLIPDSLNFVSRVFNFNKCLKKYMKYKEYFLLNVPQFSSFYEQFFDLDQLEIVGGLLCITQKRWDKQYQACMDEARIWLKHNQKDLLNQLNEKIFTEAWNKYAEGSISHWEMDSLCFYYHSHELINVNKDKYGIKLFSQLPTSPIVDCFFKRGKKQIPIFKTERIVGTVIGKNDSRSSISLLTEEGVVNVKFTKDYFAMFNRQISEKQTDGKKKVVEKGWFLRGTKLMVNGFRRDDFFQAKRYANTNGHQLYKIIEVTPNGELMLVHERYGI